MDTKTVIEYVEKKEAKESHVKGYWIGLIVGSVLTHLAYYVVNTFLN